MNNMRMSKEEFVARVTVNRDNHRAIFEKAQEGYKAFLIKELERRLDDARRGLQIDRMIRLIEPQDHTDEYNQVLLMAELSVEETVVLSTPEFRCYIMDSWGWKQEWEATASSYGVSV